MKKAFHIGLKVRWALMERDLAADVVEAEDGMYVYAWTGYGTCVHMRIDELLGDASPDEIAAVIEDLFLEAE